VKALLALATVALIALVVEDRARQVAHETSDAFGVIKDQAQAATGAVAQKVEQVPLISLVVATVVGYFLSGLMPRKAK
jgi:ElaB/YqjD/DUF883 family membrane-anchored ribosome-binding protein